MRERNEALEEIYKGIDSMLSFFETIFMLPKVREINWLMLLFFVPLCAISLYELTLGRPPLMPWETWYDSLGVIETIRLYVLMPFLVYTLYAVYRLYINEAHQD